MNEAILMPISKNGRPRGKGIKRTTTLRFRKSKLKVIRGWR